MPALPDTAIRGTSVLDPRMLIGGERRAGSGAPFQAVSPLTGRPLLPVFTAGSSADIEDAARRANEAFGSYRKTSPRERADLLYAIADELERYRNRLVQRAFAESALPQARLNSELGRTTGQLRFVAESLLDGWPFEVRIDTADADRTPAPRPDLRLIQVPVGPVVVFGASNFPFAFSNAGGDTAAALAAGCPVIVKCHEAHPGTAILASEAIDRAVQATGMPAGIYSALLSPSHEFSTELVSHPLVRAVGFTGSRRGGTALMQAAASRPRPIPVYAEMSSVNPVILLGEAAGQESAAGFVASLTLGGGQFCTNPGLLFVLDDEHGEEFTAAASAHLSETTGVAMLSPGIASAYEDAVAQLRSRPEVRLLAQGAPGDGPCAPAPALLSTTADAFIADQALQEEMFGAAALIVRCTDTEEIQRCLDTLGGQLTATVHATPAEHTAARQLLPTLEELAGRIIVNGWPTGVEVADAMVHGGPFPATSDSRTTSVGALAITRFLRPVSWQNTPDTLLPTPLRDDNPWHLPRRIDSRRES